MNQTLKEIDGKLYQCTEIKPADQLIQDLQDGIKEYDKLMLEVYDLENTIEEQEKAVSSLEYSAEYLVINQKDESGKELNTNETKRKLAKLEILKTNEIYQEAIKLRQNNQNVLKLKKNRLNVLEFKTGIYKRILEYRARND